MRLEKISFSAAILCSFCLLQAFSAGQDTPFGKRVVKEGERRKLDFYRRGETDPNPIAQTDEQRSDSLRKRLQAAIECINNEDFELFFEEFVDPTAVAALACETDRTVDSIVYDSLWGTKNAFSKGIERSLEIDLPRFFLGGRVACYSNGSGRKAKGQLWVYVEQRWRVRF